jgi:hypothetical protein
MHFHAPDQQTTAGTIIGACCGFVKAFADHLAAFKLNMTDVKIFGMITVTGIMEAATYAFVGATVGFFATELWKFLKRKIFKSKTPLQ